MPHAHAAALRPWHPAPAARTGVHWLAALVLLVLSLGVPTTPRAAGALPPPQAAYLAELTARAEALRLWEARPWQVLLHYRADALGGGVTSEADGPGFFNAPDGRTDPRAELAATLAAFFSADILPPGGMTAQCTFPARYAWLDERLGFDPQRLPRQPCPRFEAWRARLDPQSVTLIYASYFLNNPASMFGHTLLRFDKRGRREEERLLDYAVNFGAAVPDDENPLRYVALGVSGGYRGYFSLLPFYVKVNEYNDFESRDLWEYELSLTPAQLDRLVAHTWEMGSTWFDYFFFRENCSYHLLSLLEAADPALRLRERFPGWALPTETVRQVTGTPGLVRRTVYRPSRSSRIAQKMDALTPPERAAALRLIADADADPPGFAALPVATQALILETAIDHHQYRLAGEPAEQPALRRSLRTLLVRRSRVPHREARDFAPRAAPPEVGHGPVRLHLAAGASGPGENFAEVGVQPAFHDLLSASAGFAAHSQLNALRLRLRHERRPDGPGAQTVLEEATVVDAVSLFPWTPWQRQPSWRLRAGWARARDLPCPRCAPFGLDGGVGVTLGGPAAGDAVGFAFLEAALQAGGAFAEGHRAGLGASAGVLADPAPWWRIALSGGYTRYSTGDRAEVRRAELAQRFALGRDLELRVDWRRVEDHREAALGLGVFF